MQLPSSNIGRFVAEKVNECYVSQRERVQRGAYYRSLYLSGDENGNTATYNKTNSYIDTLASLFYSPVELRFDLEQYGQSSPVDRAKRQAAAAELLSHIRGSDTDTKIDQVVPWALVKGKAFLKLLWSSGNLLPVLVQPEVMGVWQENLSSLDDQELFVHSTFITPNQFERIVSRHPNRAKLVRNVTKYINPSSDGGDDPASNTFLKQIILGGLQPYQSAGSPPQNRTKGVVNWLAGPSANLAPQVYNKIIRLDEVWIRDYESRDARENGPGWITVQLVGDDCILFGDDIRANLIALDPTTGRENPRLRQHHPFKEFCLTPLDGYFWGRSELCNVGLIQVALNARVDGINSLLRLQEKPPYKITGNAGTINQNVIARINKPNGWFTDNNPQVQVQSLAPVLPAGLFESLHELEGMFDNMSGFVPTIQGRGEAGVRAQAQAQTLATLASTRFKKRAILNERAVESVGSLAFEYIRAHEPETLTAWIMPGQGGTETKYETSNITALPPAKGMEAIEFTLDQLPEKLKVTVDGHSSSPIFALDTRTLLFDLARLGAITKEDLIAGTAPPHASDILSDIERQEIEQSAFLAAHPEVAVKEAGKRKK